jgi:hypothetical protein
MHVAKAQKLRANGQELKAVFQTHLGPQISTDFSPDP